MSDLKQRLTQALEKVWNNGDVEAINEYYHPDFVMQFAALKAGDETTMGFADLANDITEFKAAFPDFHEVVHDLICEGDQVVARLTLIGTQVADYEGFACREKKFEIESVDIYKFSDGKLIRQWGVMDIAAMHRQLGWQ